MSFLPTLLTVGGSLLSNILSNNSQADISRNEQANSLLNNREQREFEKQLNELNRAQASQMQKAGFGQETALQQGQQKFTGQENAAQRALQQAMQQAGFGQETALQQGQQKFTGQENAAQRALQQAMQQAGFGQETALQQGQQKFTGQENAAQRALQQAMQQAGFGQETALQNAQFNQQNNVLNRQYDYANQMRDIGQKNQQSGEQQLLNNTELQTPELSALQSAIRQNSTPEQIQALNQTKLNLAQQGVRGGAASTILGRQSGEMNRGLNQDISQLALQDAYNRQQTRNSYFGNKALAGQASSSQQRV